VTDQTPPNFRALAELAARNYVLRPIEESRAEDTHGDLDYWPTLDAEHINHAYGELTAGVSNVTVAFTPDRRLPVVQEDGRIHYCRTETMTSETVNAALVTLATEYAWLTHYQAQRADEFAALLRLRSRLESGNG
jgi:hypothetical protein